MVDAILSLVITRLSDLVIGESVFLCEVHDGIEQLKDELVRMRCFLKHVDSRSQVEDDRVKNWIKEIRDVAYKIEDIADSFALQFGWQRATKGLGSSIKRYAFILFHLNLVHKICKEIDKLKLKILDISSSRNLYSIPSIDVRESTCDVQNSLQERRRMALYNDNRGVIGFEEHRRQVLCMLLDKKHSERSGISIVGMGGIGKTTLAKLVYDDASCIENFSCRVWISLSKGYINKYGVDDILVSIASNAMGISKRNMYSMGKENMRRRLTEFLLNKIYLIVLDDVWESDVWELIRVHLPDMNNGSRVMITTRNENVARFMAPSFPPYKVQPLTRECSWELFTKKAFLNEDDFAQHCVGTVKEIAETIVKGCGGLPLALVLLGSLLLGKERTTNEWQKLVGGINWEQEVDKKCIDIIRLSYDDLPYYMKLCFLYLSAYPKGHEIGMHKLIRLLVAEGLIAEGQESSEKMMEDVAEDYLEELNCRCLIQLVQISEGYKYKLTRKCRVHDLLYDLSSREAKEVNFLDASGEASEFFTARRMVLHTGTFLSAEAQKKPHLRTLLSFTGSRIDGIKSFKFLRVLDLEGTRMTTISKEIGKLFLLKYLGLRRTYLEKLPSTVTNLRVLQTLDLRQTLLRHFPQGIWNTKTLRHLHFGELVMPKICVQELKTLHTLNRVLTGPWVESSLGILNQLRSLIMFGSFSGYICQGFPSRLTEVELCGTQMDSNVWAMLEKLQLLKILRLLHDSYGAEIMICSEGGFSQLQDLTIESCFSLKRWTIRQGALVFLRRLIIRYCNKLEALPEGIQHLIHLQELECSFMSNQFISQLEKDKGEDWYKIKHVPDIRFPRHG